MYAWIRYDATADRKRAHTLEKLRVVISTLSVDLIFVKKRDRFKGVQGSRKYLGKLMPMLPGSARRIHIFIQGVSTSTYV